MNLFDIYSQDGHQLFLARYPNESGPCELAMAKNEEDVQTFLNKHDFPGYGVYVALAHLKNGWRNKENVLTLQWLFAEVDFKDHPSLAPEDIYQRLVSMPMKPSMIVFSGHGYHAYWLLSEPVDASPGDGQTRVEDALKLACSYVGGDPHVAEASRVLRLPSSHNTRNPGESILVEIRLQELDRTYELSDLVDFWLEAQPIMPPPIKKEKEHPVNGTKYDGPFNADADLTAMRFKGSPSIHYTQLRVAAKLCSEGKLVDDIVNSILAATQKAVAEDERCKTWDWNKEEVAVRKMCHDWINKRMLEDGDDLSHCLNDKLYNEWAVIRDSGKRPYVSRNRFGVYLLAKEWFEEPKSAAAEKATVEEKADEEDDERTLIEAGAWLHGSTPPPIPKCSFERFLPEVGAGTLVAQYGCHKTHVITDLSVAFAAPDEESTFAGRKRMRRGGVVLIEFENSGIPLRVACAAKHRRTQGALPLMALPSAPPIIMRKKVNPEAVKWYRKVLSAAQRTFQKRFGLPLGMVGIDPLIDAADLENENDNSEANRAMKAFDDLAKEFNCLFVVNDHAGKDATRGSRGASSKPGKSHFILILPEKVESPAQHRTMTVKKLRAQPDGWGVEFWLEVEDVETEGGGTASNLAVCWGDEVQGNATQEEGPRGRRPPRQQMAALKVLAKLVTGLPRRVDASAWVSLERWYEELVSQHVIDPEATADDKRHAFRRIKEGLQDKDEIEIRGERVCLPD
jgi:hypothetical protein